MSWLHTKQWHSVSSMTFIHIFFKFVLYRWIPDFFPRFFHWIKPFFVKSHVAPLLAGSENWQVTVSLLTVFVLVLVYSLLRKYNLRNCLLWSGQLSWVQTLSVVTHCVRLTVCSVSAVESNVVLISRKIREIFQEFLKIDPVRENTANYEE